MNEIKELKTILNGCQPKKYAKKSDKYPGVFDPEDSANSNKMQQWQTPDGSKYFPAGVTSTKLPPGFYEAKFEHQRGHFFEKIDIRTEGLLRFPETNSDKVISDIKKFWDREDKYKKHNLSYKRGIILWGPPGSGKSCTIQIVLQDVIERGGVAVKFDNPDYYLECIRMFREIQPDTPLVTLMEDIDSILEEWSESEVLNILDGVERTEKVVYIATTNYPEQLGDRIINRPSRFDKRFKMPHPGAASRRLYFEHLFTPELVEEYSIDIEKWIKDTKNMSIAHLKELFLSVCVFDESYENTISVLSEMCEEISSKDAEPNKQFGFKIENENEEE